jgi:hypothetical protein
LYQEPLTTVFVGGSEIEKKIEGNLCQLSKQHGGKPGGYVHFMHTAMTAYDRI